jgi:hypothetical protein
MSTQNRVHALPPAMWPRQLFALVAVAGVLGAIAVATRPRDSLATPIVAVPSAAAPLERTTPGNAGEVIATVALATLEVDWVVGECPLLFVVRDRSGRAIGLYEHLEEAMASHPEIHAGYYLGAFAGLPFEAAEQN